MLPPPPPVPTGPIAWPLERPAASLRYSDKLGAQRPHKGPPVRHHAGIDLAAAYGEVVRAMVPGRVLTTFGWQGKGADAIVVGNKDAAILYGAVAPNSWTFYGVEVGDDVEAGQPIAAIGRYPDGSTMLHISAHAPKTRDPDQWWWGKMPPADLRDVRVYLDAAIEATRAPSKPPAKGGGWSIPWPSSDDVDELVDDVADLWSKLPGLPSAPPPPSPGPTGGPVAGALAMAAAVVLLMELDK